MKANPVLLMVILLAMLAASSFPAAAQEGVPDWYREAKKVATSPLVEKATFPLGSQAVANWYYGYIEIVGKATSKRGDSREQELLMAEEAARVVALNLLAQFIGGLKATGAASVKDMQFKAYGGAVSWEQFISPQVMEHTIEIKKEARWGHDAAVGYCKLGYLMYGRKGLEAIVKELNIRTNTASPTETIAPYEPAAPPPSPAPEQRFTGLIIDARGSSISPVMFPRILVEKDGRALYNSGVVNNPKADNGTAGYVLAIDQARQDPQKRGLGDNPLVVKATGSSGNDIIISSQDAAKIYAADLQSQFLSEAKVYIVTN